MDHEGDEAWVDITDDPDAIMPDLLFSRVPEGNVPEVRVGNRVRRDRAS
jgi:hypothetical protein